MWICPLQAFYADEGLKIVSFQQNLAPLFLNDCRIYFFFFALPAFSNCKLCLLPIFFYRFCLDTNHFRCKMFQIDQNKKFVFRFFYDLILRRQSTMVQSLYPGITNFRKMCFFQKSILRTCTKLPNFEQWW